MEPDAISCVVKTPRPICQLNGQSTRLSNNWTSFDNGRAVPDDLPLGVSRTKQRPVARSNIIASPFIAPFFKDALGVSRKTEVYKCTCLECVLVEMQAPFHINISVIARIS